MRRPALEIALILAERPASARSASRMPLPSGMTFLLEVATGDAAALDSAQMTTNRPQIVLRKAAAFFIEQVLFTQTADSYRVLGATSAAPRRELRRHMALLVRWLHSDRLVRGADDFAIDRSIFVYRVTRAWDDLKHDQRRAAYDLALADKSNGVGGWRGPLSGAPGSAGRGRALISHDSIKRRTSRRLVIYKVEGDTLLGRLLYYLGRQA